VRGPCGRLIFGPSAVDRFAERTLDRRCAPTRLGAEPLLSRGLCALSLTAHLRALRSGGGGRGFRRRGPIVLILGQVAAGGLDRWGVAEAAGMTYGATTTTRSTPSRSGTTTGSSGDTRPPMSMPSRSGTRSTPATPEADGHHRARTPASTHSPTGGRTTPGGSALSLLNAAVFRHVDAVVGRDWWG